MNLFEGDTAALAALANDAQGQRLLRLRFPDGDGPADALMLANRLDASESLSRDFRYRVEVLSDDANIPLEEVMGKMATVELVREDGSLRYFNGYVFAFGFVKTDGGFAYYDMLLGPWLAWLRPGRNQAAFHGLNVAELTGKVFERYLMRDWKSALSGPDPDITYLCQHKESDHNLLHRHWERLGWFYRYEHRADGHTLWLGDDTTSGMPIAGAGASMPFQHQAGSMEDDGVHAWSAVRRPAPGKTTLASFNFKHPRVA
ncbi:MAG TPA: type VI secretion system Vgr family protein, partial [Janthinobacterium sp.]|nr:type VI secretion system Vgr family protein [Janthinobacterium sp.]